MYAFDELGKRASDLLSVTWLCKYAMFGANVPQTSIVWVSESSLETVQKYGLLKKVEPVRNCRNIGKKDMKWNAIRPKMKVDPENYVSIMYRSLMLMIC